MTTNQLGDDLATWSLIFRSELESHLEAIGDAACGFAIELPSDFGNDGLISRIAATKSELADLDNWEYVPNNETFAQSCDGLTALYAKYSEQLDDETFYDEFGNRLYTKILISCRKSERLKNFHPST